jgi:hypothetical protein
MVGRSRKDGWLRHQTILRTGPRGPIVGRVDTGASAQQSNGDQPGDLTMREAAAGLDRSAPCCCFAVVAKGLFVPN